MKKLLPLLILLVSISFASAQTMSVSSFRKLENDLTARVTSPKLDQNGEKAAIVKIVTSQTGFSFDGGVMGVVDSEQHPGEIWLYLPHDIKRISIMHQQLGVLRNYYFPEKIDVATTYELVLVSGTVTTVVDQDPGAQYFVIRYTPDDVDVDLYIDEENYYQGADGYISVPLTYGKHTYRIESPKYHPYSGVVEMGSEKKEIAAQLKTMCGSAYISTSPENGAEVYYNGKMIGTTPCATDELIQGEYEITLKSQYYLPKTTKISIVEGEQTIENIALERNYSDVVVRVSEGAGIYVNNEFKGNDSISMRLTPGTHIFEARKESHRTYRTSREIKARQNEEIFLNTPTPIYGSVEVKSNVPDAEIKIDGKLYGTTPVVINNVLIGSHKLEINKSGYDLYSKQISVVEGETLSHTAELKEFSAAPAIVTTGGSNSSDNRYSPPTSNRNSSGSHTRTRYKKNSVSTNMGINIFNMDFAGNNFGFSLPALFFGIGGYENTVNFTLGAQYRWITSFQTENSSDYGEPYLYTDMISVPVNVRFNLGSGLSDTQGFLSLGVHYNYMITSKAKYKIGYGDSAETYEMSNLLNEYPEFVNRSTFSGIFNVGLLIGDDACFSELSLFARYDLLPMYNPNSVSEYFTDYFSSYAKKQGESRLFIGINWTMFFKL